MLKKVRANIKEVEIELGRLSTSERWAAQAVYLMQMPGVGIVITMTNFQLLAIFSVLKIPRSWWVMPVWDQAFMIPDRSTGIRA